MYMYVMELNLVCFSLKMHGSKVKTVKCIQYGIITQIAKLFEFGNGLKRRMTDFKWECIIYGTEYDQ